MCKFVQEIKLCLINIYKYTIYWNTIAVFSGILTESIRIGFHSNEVYVSSDRLPFDPDDHFR